MTKHLKSDRRASGVIFGNTVNEETFSTEEKKKLWNCDTLSWNPSRLKQQQEHPNNLCRVSLGLDKIPSRCSFKIPSVGQKVKNRPKMTHNCSDQTDFLHFTFLLRTKFYCLFGSVENNSLGQLLSESWWTVWYSCKLYGKSLGNIYLNYFYWRYEIRSHLFPIWGHILLYKRQSPLWVGTSYYNGIRLLAELEASDALKAVFVTNRRFFAVPVKASTCQLCNQHRLLPDGLTAPTAFGSELRRRQVLHLK